MGWLVGRYRAEDRTPEREADLIAVLQEHGLNPADIMLAAAVTQDDAGRYQLHFSRWRSGEHGGWVLDVARNQPVSEPVVIDVEPCGWPAWLTGLNVPAPS